MPLQAGVRLGPYEVIAPLGAGGMGEVYRARDTRLRRDVAIKILPELFAADPDRRSRFQREAHVLASLNHPNIASIYGFEGAETTGALVLELVEGPTLAERLQQGPVPLDDALPLARQIAEALESAHGRGIIHRDLKPANVKVRPDGSVKVLDFGLAKALDRAVASEAAASRTRTSPAVVTHAGIVLGTAAYMAPEQAKGRDVDARADVWAFGCVLFEMLTAAPPFGGETVSEMLASVLRSEPDWRLLPSDTPEGIRRLLRRCLQKDPARRLQHIGDARIEIDETLNAPAKTDRAPALESRRRAWWAWLAAGVLAVVAATLGLLLFRPTPEPDEVRLEITTPPTTDPVSLAISPDGRKIVYVATTPEGRTPLWLRQLHSSSARPLPGTDSGSLPFWSPDSRSIGFFAEGKLKRISLDSGAVHVLANAQGPAGGTWNRDDTILFCPNISGDIYRVPAAGGAVQATVTRSDGRQRPYRYPQFLPDGRHFIYSVTSGADSGIYAGNLDGSVSARLLDADSPAVYGSGHLFFIRQGALFAQAFDPDRLRLTGSPIPVAEQVSGDRFGAPVSAAIAGPIVYRAGSSPRIRQLVWVDRSGKELERVGEPDPSFSPSLSADGRRMALHRVLGENPDIWWFGLDRPAPQRFTTNPANDIHPIWSPDGDRIVYASLRDKVYDLYVGSLTGTGAHELLLATSLPKRPMDWSADGRFVLFRVSDPATGVDIWALPMGGDRKPFPVVQTEFEERDAQFSPDGKWIVYESNKSGRSEIVAQPFLRPGSEVMISVNGGGQVRWGRDGKEIYHIALDGRLMSVPVATSPDGQAFEAGTPVPLFPAGIGPAVQRLSGAQYVVSGDGRRFLLNRLTEESRTLPITVILNWKPKPP